MTESITQTELKSKMPKSKNFYMPLRSLLVYGLIITVCVSAFGSWLAMMLINEREELILNQVHKRVELLSAGRSEVVSTWIDGLAQVGNHITKSDVFRLFATEMELTTLVDEDNKEVEASLAAQLPYMQKVMADYAQQNGLPYAAVMNRLGEAYLTNGPRHQTTPEQKAAVKEVYATGKARVLPFHSASNQLIVDVVKPIFMLEEEGREQKVIGALLSTFSVTDSLSRILGDSPLAQAGERVHLMQKDGEDVQKIHLDKTVATWGVDPTFMTHLQARDAKGRAFQAEESPVDNESVYFAAKSVDGTPYTILQEYEASDALKPLVEYRQNVAAGAVMLILLVIAALMLMVAYLLGSRNRTRVRIQEQAMHALVNAVEIRDPYLAGHHGRVARLAVHVGNQMRLSIPERSTLYYAALLSGVGKIFIPEKILTKKTKLSAAEMDTMREHVNHAMNVLGDIDFEFPITPVIRQMYERMDGTGYPEGAQGLEINLLSRILGACDAYCAMVSPRSYRKAMSRDNAMSELEKLTEQYDKGVISVIGDIAQ